MIESGRLAVCRRWTIPALPIEKSVVLIRFRDASPDRSRDHAWVLQPDGWVGCTACRRPIRTVAAGFSGVIGHGCGALQPWLRAAVLRGEHLDMITPLSTLELIIAHG